MTDAKVSGTSIKRLRIYQASRGLEDAVYELVKQLPEVEFYGLGNDLRRSSAAVSHYLTEFHRRFSYGVKLEALHLARTEAEALRQLLQEHEDRGFGPTESLREQCTVVVKQSWGMIKYLKQRQAERRIATRVQASDELVAARA